VRSQGGGDTPEHGRQEVRKGEAEEQRDRRSGRTAPRGGRRLPIPPGASRYRGRASPAPTASTRGQRRLAAMSTLAPSWDSSFRWT
jgi:hypothetical protein